MYIAYRLQLHLLRSDSRTLKSKMLPTFLFVRKNMFVCADLCQTYKQFVVHARGILKPTKPNVKILHVQIFNHCSFGYIVRL